MERKLITAVLLLAVAISVTQALTISNTVTIPGVCGLTASLGSLGFGSVSPGTTSAENSTVANNTGNTAANLTIKGTTWTFDGDTMSVSQTKFATASGTYASKTALSTGDQTLVNNLNKSTTATVFLQLAVPAGQNPGSYAQTVTITATC
ncbi:MAG: hypothetical protein AABX01_05580 [Candidatus Micrarchaeota archaeon]|mgnify:CR=1